VLDLMLPGEDGLRCCAGCRPRPTRAVLMLTARGDTMSRVVGLELGADDYLAKPFEPRELVARLQALVRRATKGRCGRCPLLRFGRWRFDRMARQLINAEDVGIALSAPSSGCWPPSCSARAGAQP
jgi:two-component system OmpR family response regulator